MKNKIHDIEKLIAKFLADKLANDPNKAWSKEDIDEFVKTHMKLDNDKPK